MRKLLTWTFVSLTALLVMGLVALDLFSNSTARQRDAAIASARARPMAESPATPADLTDVTPSPGLKTTSTPHLNCDEQAARWESLNEQFRLGTYDEDREQWGQLHTLLNGAQAIITNRFDPIDFGDSFISELDSYVSQNERSIALVKSLLLNYSPECEFLQALKVPDYYHLEFKLLVELGSSLHRADYDTVIENLTAMIALGYMSQGYQFPHKIEPYYARILLDAINSDLVQEETWRRFLHALRAYRNRDFMIHYVRQYPHIPFGATVQENSYFRRGVRAVIREVQQPALDRDAIRFAPVLDQLASLSKTPYYEAKPKLQAIIDEYNLNQHDRHSYLNESAARASIVNLVHTVFPRNAVVQLQVDLFSLCVGLEIIHAQTGVYPESLDAISSVFETPAPLNPFSGAPYDYYRKEDGYRLAFVLEHSIKLSVTDDETDNLGIESFNGKLWLVSEVVQ